MANYVEPYAKENNILQLSLFYFGKGRPEKTCVQWKDHRGEYKLICDCSYGVPGAFDQDVYASCMRIWAKQGMPSEKITTNYSEIARELGLDPVKWNRKIKDALKRLGKARYEFHRCFIRVNGDDKRLETVFFSLFDTASLFDFEKGKSKKYSRFELVFPDAIKENLEAKYYQILDMGWYRSLPGGLARRLYEYLEKRRYHNIEGKFTIAEEAICRWLPITDKNVTNRRKRLRKISQDLITAGYLLTFEFDKKKNQCMFVYAPKGEKKSEANVQSVSPVEKIEKITKETKIAYFELVDWLSNIPLRRQQSKEIASLPMTTAVKRYLIVKPEYDALCNCGEKPKASWVYGKFIEKEQMAKTLDISPQQMEMFQDENLSSLMELLKVKKVTAKLKKELKNNLAKKGYEYVKGNILYANKNAKKSYQVYLQKALIENWAEEWLAQKQEQKEVRQKEEIKVKTKKIEKEKEQEHLQQLRILFKEKVKQVDSFVQEKLWEKAQNSFSHEHPGRNLNIKIKFANLLLSYLNGIGENFPKQIVSGIDFIEAIALQK